MALTDKLTNIANAIREKTDTTNLYTLTAMATAIADMSTEISESGEDGGYYTPVVTQTNDSTITISFVASKDDMPEVEPTVVELPTSSNSVRITSIEISEV